MTVKHWTDIGHSILLAVGLLVSTALAMWTSDAGWWVMSGPLLLALLLLFVDVLIARSRGVSRGPSWTAVILGFSFITACAIVALRDPALVAMMIAVLGGCVVTPVLLPLQNRRKACRWL
jgi:hypothetical protein